MIAATFYHGGTPSQNFNEMLESRKSFENLELVSRLNQNIIRINLSREAVTEI